MKTDQERRQEWKELQGSQLTSVIMKYIAEHQNRTHRIDLWHRGHSLGIGVALSVNRGLIAKVRPTANPTFLEPVALHLVKEGAAKVVEPDEAWRSYTLTCGECGRSQRISARRLLENWFNARNEHPGAYGRPRMKLPE